METPRNVNYSFTMRIAEFEIPPVSDGLVLGKDSPIGYSAFTKALNLLSADHMQSIEVDDDVISHVILRNGILRRVPQERLIAFVLQRVKPLMSATEILHLNIKAEVVIEEMGT